MPKTLTILWSLLFIGSLQCRNEVPVGKSPFLSYEGQSSNHYIWLTGEISLHYKNRIPFKMFPVR